MPCLLLSRKSFYHRGKLEKPGKRIFQAFSQHRFMKWAFFINYHQPWAWRESQSFFRNTNVCFSPAQWNYPNDESSSRHHPFRILFSTFTTLRSRHSTRGSLIGNSITSGGRSQINLEKLIQTANDNEKAYFGDQRKSGRDPGRGQDRSSDAIASTLAML